MAGFGRRESSHPINSSPNNLNGVVVLQDAVSSIRVEAGEGWTEVLCLLNLHSLTQSQTPSYASKRVALRMTLVTMSGTSYGPHNTMPGDHLVISPAYFKGGFLSFYLDQTQDLSRTKLNDAMRLTSLRLTDFDSPLKHCYYLLHRRCATRVRDSYNNTLHYWTCGSRVEGSVEGSGIACPLQSSLLVPSDREGSCAGIGTKERLNTSLCREAL